jgi:hypothetical protein
MTFVGQGCVKTRKAWHVRVCWAISNSSSARVLAAPPIRTAHTAIIIRIGPLLNISRGGRACRLCQIWDNRNARSAPARKMSHLGERRVLLFAPCATPSRCPLCSLHACGSELAAMSDLSQNRKDFEAWFVAVLRPLMMEDPNSGFVLAMVAFPLLERYLRRKSGASPKQIAFQDALLAVLPELQNRDNAETFWKSYRHGLLHNVILDRDKDWLSLDVDIIRVDADRLWMNPALFAVRVVETIDKDFETFAKDPTLPQVQVVQVPPSPAAPGPYQIVLGTGGRR